ncbi:MAG TPA: alpha-amylase family glycosyl hydrolase [Thermoanaerobaculaceae bacterium]|nr:alpha-amylase family glycosyl hydrolase [Thermoanaerobaculaceae bacterium]
MVHAPKRSDTPRRHGGRFLTLVVPALAAAVLLVLAASGLGQEQRVPRRVLQRAAPVWNNDWSKGAVFYEVFVRSFQDSNGDGIGDLKGLISKLDYLNDGNPASTTDLGVDALWLMPVFGSPSYHGYDTTDYETINPEYGTNDDFATLCTEAHRRGIKVILDFVINHSGSGHPWFVDASSAAGAPKRNWYIWSPVDLGWRQPWNLYTGADTWHRNPADGQWFYGVFWEGMPDLNIRNPEVRAEIKRLATLWLSRGADGFRLDAARHLVENGGGLSQVDQPETHAFWREFSAHVRSVKPDATLVGEAWTDTPIIATYYGSTTTVPGGDELPMNFDFPLAAAIVQGVNGGDANVISAKLAEVQSVYPQGADDAPFLTNHDQFRLATQLGNNIGKLRNAVAILLTVPGTPFLYYGEEVGLQNGGSDSDDRLKRTPMPWDASSPGGGFTTGIPWFPFAPGRETTNVATESADPASLLGRYRALIRARHTSLALQKGDLRLVTAGGGGHVLAFFRSTTEEQVLVGHNLSDAIQTAGPFATTATTSETVFADTGASIAVGGGSCTLTLLPRTTGIWRLK